MRERGEMEARPDAIKPHERRSAFVHGGPETTPPAVPPL